MPGCENASRPADPENWRVAKTVFVADEADVAQRHGKGEENPCRFNHKQFVHKLKNAGRSILFKNSNDAPDDSVTLDGVVNDLVTCGTPEQVTERPNNCARSASRLATPAPCSIAVSTGLMPNSAGVRSC